ncbi:methylglyoxal reductase (NADPH-dependent) gre2 [Tulasnella sp. 427]|nr:methylglyoxal reductase (NADPH-dependent) gre2 [Tulasnella sp. 427]
MPAVAAPAKVLVTGASGYIAVWVCKTLLEKGYSVVGTVRSDSKGEKLKELFKDYDGKFSYVIVEDISKDGAFDTAVVGADAVQHTASPVTFEADDPQGLIAVVSDGRSDLNGLFLILELIGPAVKGTTGILESIKAYAPTVKRVVLTSSVGSIYHQKTPPVFDESDWNVDAPKAIEKFGRHAPGPVKYSASKVLAERGAWEFMDKNKDSINFDLVAINPSFVWGPLVGPVTSEKELNGTITFFREHTSIRNPAPPKEELIAPGSCVDVRDVALVHTLALSNPEAAGQRFIANSGSYTYQDILDIIHERGDNPDVPKGFPGAGKDVPRSTFLKDKAEKTFGIKFRSLQEISVDTLTSLRQNGL